MLETPGGQSKVRLSRPEGDPHLPYGPRYPTYGMSLLVFANVLNALDRQIVNVLAERIKQDLQLADWQIGAIGGLAFALFYTVFGIVIGRQAERRDRRLIISISLATWSAFTALCGLAQNFVQLLLLRVGVAIGEAGCTPASHSLISDYVPKERRVSALGIFSAGAPLGFLAGMALGGLVADGFGWRAAFVAAGLPGLLLSLLLPTTLREPRNLRAAAPTPASSLRATLSYLAGKRTFRVLVVTGSLIAFIGYGQGLFIVSFFLRCHGDELVGLTSEFNAAFGFKLQPLGFLGIALGLIAGITGAIGASLGGLLADCLGRRDPRSSMIIPGVTSFLLVPIFIAVLSTSSIKVALSMMVACGALSTVFAGPLFGAFQSIVPRHMRATTAAILLFSMNLVGLGLGPLTVGALSDWINIGLGYGPAEGVRWSLTVVTLVGLVPAALFATARHSLGKDEVS